MSFNASPLMDLFNGCDEHARKAFAHALNRGIDSLESYVEEYIVPTKDPLWQWLVDLKAAKAVWEGMAANEKKRVDKETVNR